MKHGIMYSSMAQEAMRGNARSSSSTSSRGGEGERWRGGRSEGVDTEARSCMGNGGRDVLDPDGEERRSGGESGDTGESRGGGGGDTCFCSRENEAGATNPPGEGVAADSACGRGASSELYLGSGPSVRVRVRGRSSESGARCEKTTRMFLWRKIWPFLEHMKRRWMAYCSRVLDDCPDRVLELPWDARDEEVARGDAAIEAPAPAEGGATAPGAAADFVFRDVGDDSYST
jgi:hypothetical protein